MNEEQNKIIASYQDFEIDGEEAMRLLMATGMSSSEAEGETIDQCENCRGSGKVLVGQYDDVSERNCHCRADDDANNQE